MKELDVEPLAGSDGHEPVRAPVLRGSPRPRPPSEALGKRPRTRSAVTAPRSAATRARPRTPPPKSALAAAAADGPATASKPSGLAGGRLRDYIGMGEEIQRKEQFTVPPAMTLQLTLCLLGW